MPWGPGSLLFRRVGIALLAAILSQPTYAQTNADPAKLIEQAERLAWLKAWTRAEPLYAEADRLFTARGDPRNAAASAHHSTYRTGNVSVGESRCSIVAARRARRAGAFAARAKTTC